MSKVDLSPFEGMLRPKILGAQYVCASFPHANNSPDMSARISVVKSLTGSGNRSLVFKEAADRTYFVAGFMQVDSADRYKESLREHQSLTVHTLG